MLAAASSPFDTRRAALATLRLAVVDLLASRRSLAHDKAVVIVGVVLLLGLCALFGHGIWMRHGTSGPSVRGRLSRYRPVYQTDRLRDSDPSLKRYVDGTPMRGDGGHHSEDWEYGGDKTEWE